jgi:putative ABC transport system permease protein
MRFLLRIWAIFVVALKRLFSQFGLSLATLLGLIVSIALVMSVPAYADAVYYKMLSTGLFGSAQPNQQEAGTENREPFSFMFRYIGSWHEPVEWADVEPVDAFLSGGLTQFLNMPQETQVRHLKTDNLRLFPANAVEYDDVKKPLAWTAFSSVSDFENHIVLTEGAFPRPAVAGSEDPVEVLVSEGMAEKLGLHSGEEFVALVPQAKGSVKRTEVPVRISGVWQAKDPESSFWFYRPVGLEDQFIVPEATFLQYLSPKLENEVYLALWYFVMDGSKITVQDVPGLVGRIVQLQQRIDGLLPGTSLDRSPLAPLQAYRSAAMLLTILLYAFNVPTLALLLAFIGLTVGLAVNSRRNEIAVLRSRGATSLQVVGIAAVEALVLGLVALVAAVPLSAWIVQAVGSTTSFLDFTQRAGLNVNFSTTTIQIGLAALLIALLAQLWPTFAAARFTIVTYKQDRARMLRPPWWQRAFLDVLLLIPAAYGTYLLRQQGTVALPGAVQGGDPFANPLLFLVPALAIFAVTLLVLRLLPALMSVLAWLLSKIGGLGPMLAARQLARVPGTYIGPLILLVLTLSLSAFTASLALTLDGHLYDQSYYEVGSDMSVYELAEDTQSSGGFMFGSQGSSSDQAAADTTGEEAVSGPRWNFLPVTEYLKLPGVKAATRVGRYPASTNLSGGYQEGQFLGVDRVDFNRVSYWRRDFAGYRLGTLMNALATTPEAVLLPKDFMTEHALAIGDSVRINVELYGTRAELDCKIAGSFDLFPTWYPGAEDAKWLFVGNLDYLYEQAGDQYPYDVWLRTSGYMTKERMDRAMLDSGFRASVSDVALQRVSKEQTRPERQGLFGFLSIGFAAAALLTVLGFSLYALFSFRRRFIELGMLRAIGLSSAQMTLFLACELAFIILTGLVLGTVLGVIASSTYIPFLQVGTGPEARIPPYLVQIAWSSIERIWLLFGLLFVGVLGVLAVLLLRMRIFQAVKLGETA